MARRCTTVPGFGVCCRAAQQGLANQVFKFTDSRGHVRCAECNIVGKRNGAQGFRFRFHKNQECGIGPGGCPALAGPGTQGTLQLGGTTTGGVPSL
jgi:hypothetical protein